MAYVLINHGWTNTRQLDHWQRHLAIQLRLQGHQVNYPQYPDTETPNFEKWEALLIAELELLVQLREQARNENSNDQELIVIGHSLGSFTFLKAALNGISLELKVDRLLLVAPPSPSKLAELPSFALDLNDKNLLPALKSAARNITVVASDADPWIPEGIQASYGQALEIEPVIIQGGKHLTAGDGWGYWKGVIDWVNDPNADLKLR